MTTPDLSLNVGKVGSMQVLRPGMVSAVLTINVHVLEFKQAYGRPRYLITPVSGSGSQWVSAERVQLVNETKEENGQ